MHEGKKQIQNSYAEFRQVTAEKYVPIHDIRIKNQQLQKNSRLFDQRRTQERLVAIQQQAIAANKKNTALQIKWSELKDYQQCQSLSKAIQQQKQAFALIIAAKDKLINQFWEQLKKKDDQYSKTLKQQAVDIKSLVKNMRLQYFALRDQSIKELDQVQKKFQAQRKAYISNAKDEVDNCFKKHVDMQQSFTENRKKAEEDFQKKIQDLRIEGMQLYTSMKIKMQTDIQNLQKCYEEMKALYQLNTEKLDYNLKVLKEKKEENNHLHEQLKKKERILNIKLKNLRDEYVKVDQNFKDHNKKLTAQYKRSTRQFKELQRKFKHFQKADLQRYNQIQSMNEIDVQKLKDKIIKCDITIHEQQLGVQWAGTPQENQQEKQKQRQRQKALAALEEQQEEQVQLVVTQEKLNEMIDILIEEADFIFDDKMREQLEIASQQQKLKQRLEILKKTLNVDSIEEMNIFIEDMANACKYVSQKQKHSILQEKLRKEQQARQQQQKANRKRKRVQAEEKKVQKVEQQQEQDPKVDLKSDFKVDPVLVVDFLVQWMAKREDRKKYLQKTAKKSLKQLSQRQKKEMIAREGKKYWIKLTQVLPERTFRVWNVLEKSLAKYHELLEARQKLIVQTGELHNQNEELKNLLNQYLQINHQLIIPPTRLMEKDV